MARTIRLCLIMAYASSMIWLQSCSSSEQIDEELQQIVEVENDQEFLISESQARENAQNFINAIAKKNSAGFEKKVRKISTSPTKRMASTHAEHPGYYIFNFDDNAGFVVASADKRDSVGIYLASLSGELTEDIWNDSKNGFGLIKELVTDYHNMMLNPNQRPAKTRKKDRTGDYEGVITTDTTYNYPPLLTTAWHQEYPFNYRTDNCLLGCGPVALGQIMAYYQAPNASLLIKGTHYTFDWNKISQIHTSLDAFYNPSSAKEVYKLISSIGECGNAIYSVDGTGMSVSNMGYALDKFGYNYDLKNSFSYSSILTERSNHRPVLMVGWSQSSGHAWVVDGAYEVVHSEGWYNPDTGEILENDIFEEFNFTEINRYLWVNWGWGGSPDSKLYSHEHQSSIYGQPVQINAAIFSSGTHSFNNNLKMWIGIEPK